jgi:hypothetical protein
MKLTDILSEIKIKPAISIPSPEEVWELYSENGFTYKGLILNFMPDEFLGYSIYDRGSDNSTKTITYYFRVSLPDTSPWLKVIQIGIDRDTGNYSYWGENNHDINDPMWQDTIRNLKK